MSIPSYCVYFNLGFFIEIKITSHLEILAYRARKQSTGSASTVFLTARSIHERCGAKVPYLIDKE